MATRAAAPASPGPDAAALRLQTNLRAVQRADPSLAEILDTANYTVIYHYGDDRWIKQKQEGSMFVVRRWVSLRYRRRRRCARCGAEHHGVHGTPVELELVGSIEVACYPSPRRRCRLRIQHQLS